jgi:glutathione synthase
MHFALIIDPLESLKPSKDSSIAIMRAAAERGHTLSTIAAGSLLLREECVFGRAQQLHMASRSSSQWCTPQDEHLVALRDFDAVLMRQDPPFDLEYLYSTHLLELAENQGALVFNSPSALRDHNEKLAATRFSQYTPATLVGRDARYFREFLAEHRDVIVKPLDGMGGSSIFRIREGDPNTSVIIETITQQGTQTVMAQAYLPEIVDGDKRVLVVDGEPAPYSLARIPAAGETRGNLAAGGRGEARPLTDRDREIALEVGAYARTQGLLLVGLDIIGAHLTEVNVTSPTCMVEIRDQTGFDVAEQLVVALEKKVREKRTEGTVS